MTRRLRWRLGLRVPLPPWTGPVNVQVRRQIEKLPAAVRSDLTLSDPPVDTRYRVRPPMTLADWRARYCA